MQFCKFEIFIPKSHFGELQRVLQEEDAGHIGKYDSCLSFSEVVGMWRPLEGAKPFLGKQQKLSQETELKVEVAVAVEKIAQTVAAIKKIHPYEEPVINIIPLLNEF